MKRRHKLIAILTFTIAAAWLLVSIQASSNGNLSINDVTMSQKKSVTSCTDEEETNYLIFNTGCDGAPIADRAEFTWRPESFFAERPEGLNNTIAVRNDSELKAALNNLRGGDEIVLEEATYTTTIDLSDKTFTADAPVAITPAESAYPTFKNTPSSVIKATKNASYIYIGTFQGATGQISFSAENTRTNSARAHVVELGNSNAEAIGSVHHLWFSGIEMMRSSYAMVNIKAGANNIYFLGGEYYTTGYKSPEPWYSEMFYLGSSESRIAQYGRSDPVRDIYIQGNNMHGGTAETVDIKTGGGTYNVTIEDNLIHDWAISGGHSATGAIVTGSGITKYAARELNTIVRRNRIWNITENTADGTDAVPYGIHVYGPATVENNIIWNCEDNGIHINDNIPDSQKGHGYTIRHNTVFNCKSGIAIGKTQPNSKLNIIISGNAAIIANGNRGKSFNNKEPRATDFIGPLTDAANNGGGFGSGFILSTSSTLRPTSSETDTDFLGVQRSIAATSYGALE